MRQYQQPHASWRLEGGAHVMDPETAVKDGVLGGAIGGCGAGLGTAEKLDLRNMIEEVDSAEDDIPRVFICPISLQPMVDPVTLCTGQTYERANILRWFSMGHLSCPTTMQELWDGAVTPNSTLHQLIHAWFSQRYLRLRKRSEDVQGLVAELLGSLRRAKGQARVRTLGELQRLVSAHPAAKTAVADSGGVALLSSLLGPYTSHAVGAEAIGILVKLALDSEARRGLMQPEKISLVVDLLNDGAIETKINCVRFIGMLTEERDFRPEAVSSLSLLVGLLRLVKDKRYPNGIHAGLGLLKTICAHRQLQSSAVRVGAVPQLVELLPGFTSDCSEAALHILDVLSAVPEGAQALKDCPETIVNMVRLLMRVSEACTQYALSILWTVCQHAPEECASQAVEAGLAAKLLLVIQSGCAPALKQRAAELLKLCSLNYTATLFISKCKLTRTMQ